MTKHIHEELKCSLEDVKVEVQPTCIDNSLVINAARMVSKPKSGKVKVRMVKSKVVKKTSTLEKATGHLYDLEDNHGPEKCLNIDFGLYQMEDY